MTEEYHILCYGEILWDVFADGKMAIGGAPLNVALRAKNFGLKSGIISRVGQDDLARKLKDFLSQQELNIELLQEDRDWGTGIVNVNIDAKGSAQYQIKKPSAWDYIKLTEDNISAVTNAQVFVYGSLSCRNLVSKKSLLRLIEKARFKVFDVNLRPPYYDQELLDKLMQHADLIKLNDEELSEVCELYNTETDDVNKALVELGIKTKSSCICLTRGEGGALLLYQNKFYEHQGYKVQVVDTVGAGDSFLATLVAELIIQKKPPEEALKNACAIGAIVASKPGANPNIGISDIMSITSK